MKKKIKKYKVGIDSETYAISLVDMPAIESDFVALAKQEEEKKQILLEKDEKHLVVGAVLIPDKDIYRYDGENEYYISFTKESIEKMSQEFLKEYRQNEVTLDHEEMASEVTMVESWLVVDSYKDKSNALGINVPEGTWMAAFKVNNIETWERIKKGELNGFSVESMISLEEFNKQNKNEEKMSNEEQMSLFKKFKEWLSFTKEEELSEEEKNAMENFNETIEAQMEGQEPTTEPQAEPTVEPTEPIVEPQAEPTVEPAVEEPKVEEPKVEPTVEPQNEPTEPKVEDNSHLEELINNLKAEIEALKSSNEGLTEKIKEMGKQPSTQPINTNARNGGSGGDNYSAWRDQLRNLIG